MEAELYSYVNATIWLVKGDHFFFYCDDLLKQSAVGSLNLNQLCTLNSLQNGYPRTDNVNLVVRGMLCDSQEAALLK